MRKLFLWGPPLAWAATIFALSAQPKVPETPGGDKVAHTLAYGLLGFLLARALWSLRALGLPALVLLSIALTALYGVSDEWHQSFVPGRDASGWDALADATGAVLGTALLVVAWRWRDVPRA